jgi:hypothetical protein
MNLAAGNELSFDGAFADFFNPRVLGSKEGGTEGQQNEQGLHEHTSI